MVLNGRERVPVRRADTMHAGNDSGDKINKKMKCIFWKHIKKSHKIFVQEQKNATHIMVTFGVYRNLVRTIKREKKHL